jgi:hypothetical protein
MAGTWQARLRKAPCHLSKGLVYGQEYLLFGALDEKSGGVAENEVYLSPAARPGSHFARTRSMCAWPGLSSGDIYVQSSV